jgi:hypothetical protein
MKYFDTKKDSLEEAISKAINEDNRPSAKELEEAGGKYLKYSDLLLQKGRMMAKGKNTAMIDKEISKEMKKLNIKEKMDPVGKEDGDIDNDGDKDSSDKYLAKKRKAISKAIDKNENLEEVNAKVIMDKDTGNRDLQKLLKKHKLKMKTLQRNVNPGYDEVEISGDKREMEKMMKTTGDDSMYKFNPRTKEFELDESKKLEVKTTKDVDETLDRIREANVGKGRTMRNILADIWKMNEGKNPFEKEEELTTGQKKLPPALQKAIKDKQGKKEEDEKSSKTATGQKPTKVEIEPEVK